MSTDPGNAQDWIFDFMPPGRRIDLNLRTHGSDRGSGRAARTTPKTYDNKEGEQQ